MAGSTTFTQSLGDERRHELVRSHNNVVREAQRSHGGAEIKHTGDGILASFPSASRAIACAVNIQNGVATRNQQEPETPINFRIGLNAGEPVAEDKDLFGTAVQLAARICGHAQPGQILVSNVVRELAAGKDINFVDHGPASLKGFEDPVRLYEVEWRS